MEENPVDPALEPSPFEDFYNSNSNFTADTVIGSLINDNIHNYILDKEIDMRKVPYARENALLALSVIIDTNLKIYDHRIDDSIVEDPVRHR